MAKTYVRSQQRERSSIVDRLWSAQAIKDLASDFVPSVESGITIEIVGMPSSDINNLYAAALGLAASIPPLNVCSEHAIVGEIDFTNKRVMVSVKYSANGLLMLLANAASTSGKELSTGPEVMCRSIFKTDSFPALRMPAELPAFIQVINKNAMLAEYDYIGVSSADGSAIFVPNQGQVAIQPVAGSNPKLASERGVYSGAQPQPMTYAPAVDPCSNPTQPVGSPSAVVGWNDTVLPYLKNLFGVS